MTIIGTAIVMAIGLSLLLWVVNLIRTDRLYVGYGVIFIFGTVAAMLVLALPPLWLTATRLSVVIMPEPSLSGLAIIILTFLIVYAFIQISVLANRVIKLTQELAMRDARHQDDDGAG